MNLRNELTPDTQNYRLLEHFKKYGGITTKELHRMGMDTARIRDLRPIVAQDGYAIKCRTIPGIKDNRLYEVTAPLLNLMEKEARP